MMNYSLMPFCLEKYKTNDEDIFLDDYYNNCMAIYEAKNSNQNEFIYYQTDEDGSNSSTRCDYLLIDCKNEISRYIELKGYDKSLNGKKGTTWDHAFKQLLNTYKDYGKHFNNSLGKVRFRLATSYPGTLPRYLGYPHYRELSMTGHEINILQPGKIEEI